MAADNPTPERWLPVVGFEGYYEVSDFGRVRSLDRIVHYKASARTRAHSKPMKGRILSPDILHLGYGVVPLSVCRRITRALVHHLVLTAFDRPPAIGEECDHIDFNPSNNRLSNLRWLTHLANVQHSNAAGHRPIGERNAIAKLDSAKVLEIRRRVATGESQASLGREFGVNRTTINVIVKRKNWKHI